MQLTSAMREHLSLKCPHTSKALKRLVLALEYAANNMGKRTWYGADKSAIAYKKIGPAMRDTFFALILDDQIVPTTTSDAAIEILLLRLGQFQQAYPNWPKAYHYASYFFEHKKNLAVITMDHLRSEIQAIKS